MNWPAGWGIHVLLFWVPLRITQNSAMKKRLLMGLLLLSMFRMNIIWFASLTIPAIFPKVMSNIQMPLAYNVSSPGRASL